MKEIGGYIELDLFVNNSYYKNLIELNTARNALLYLIESKKISKIYIPNFICDSITNLLDIKLVAYESYKIGRDFRPIFDKKLRNNEYIYIINYYGQINNEEIVKLKEKYKNIIVDNVQSFFQEPINGVDTIYSCRKYFGVADGAYLSTDVRLERCLDEDRSSFRMEHILGRFEGQASEYYSSFHENEESFKELPLKQMSKLTRNILGAVDYAEVIRCRNINFRYLQDHLKSNNILEVKWTDGPFAYPYYIENGIEIRKRLAEKKIYIPTLWPNVVKENHEDSVEYNYAANILPLPCDQRYGVEEMRYIVSEIREVI